MADAQAKAKEAAKAPPARLRHPLLRQRLSHRKPLRWHLPRRRSRNRPGRTAETCSGASSAPVVAPPPPPPAPAPAPVTPPPPPPPAPVAPPPAPVAAPTSAPEPAPATAPAPVTAAGTGGAASRQAAPKAPPPRRLTMASWVLSVRTRFPWLLPASALLGLGAYFLFGRRRKNDVPTVTSKIAEPVVNTMNPDTVFGTSGLGVVKTNDVPVQSQFSRSGMGTIDSGEVDPVAEAEVYIAYGREAGRRNPA